MLFKKKSLTLHAYTDRSEIYHYSQIQPSSKFKPDWWKKLPIADGEKDLSINMRGCAGFNDLYANSLTLPMWSAVQIEFSAVGNDSWRYIYADATSSADVHPETMRKGWIDDNEHQHIKLNSPWLITCDEDVDFLATNAGYSMKDPLAYHVPNGVINFKHQSGTHVNLVFKRTSDNETVMIDHGTPMMMLVPMTERKVEIISHLVSPEEYKRISNKQNPMLWFRRRYYRKKACPFAR